MRIFVGVELDEGTRIACEALALRLERGGLRASFIPPENYHLTLLFLGNVESERVASVEAALTEVAQRYAFFAVTFDRIGAFPHERQARIVFVGSRGADPAYRALAVDLRETCASRGFAAEEKDDIPHVTLARVPEKKKAAVPLIEVAPFSLRVERLTLFESVPHEGRTRYLSRGAFPLVSAV